MAVITDIWNYSLTGSSSPWRFTWGNPQIINPNLIMSYDDVCFRNPIGTLSTVYVFQVTFTGAVELGFGPNMMIYPGIYYDPGASITRLVGTIYSSSHTGFGAWSSRDLPHTNPQTIQVEIFLKQGANLIMARATYGGVTYSSGWVDGSGITNWNELVFVGNNTLTGTGAMVAPLNINYNLTDNEVDAITKPMNSGLLTSSTGKISHARVTAEYRAERDAEKAHQLLAGAH